MFSSKGKEKEIAAPAPAAPITQGKRLVRSSAAPSIISADLAVTGTLVSTGDIQIDGKVDGDVRSAGLVVGEKAYIHGDIMAEEITIRGRVEGGIRAHKVLLANTCHVEGNILHEAFAVETGAFFEGNCRHSENPLADGDAPKAVVEIDPEPDAADDDAEVSSVRPVSLAGGANYTPLKG